MKQRQKRKRNEVVEVRPSASRLTSSLRDIGYDFVTALSDVVDNSVTAGATHVDVRLEFAGQDSRVLIIDNGSGMTAARLNEALRFGSRRTYGSRDLGKFGLGLKTSSLSQCRRLTVLSRAAAKQRRIEARILDLDYVDYVDEWEVLAPHSSEFEPEILDLLRSGPGTLVVWELLDRVLTYADPTGHWARRRLDTLAEASQQYLGMVFHRFIDGEIDGRAPLKITVNGEVVQPWDPFASDEPAQQALHPRTFTVKVAGVSGEVRFRPFILPPRELFSSPQAFEHLSGPRKWNRQQGLYIYRAGRLIQHGGWCGIRTLDEHTKLARAAVEFDPALDDLFQVNVAKMRVSLPPELRTQLEKPVSELCLTADRVYREHATTTERPRPPESTASQSLRDAGFAVQATAMELGEEAALTRIMATIRERSPDMAKALGW